METFELRYFLAVAETENIRTASLRFNVSSGSLSKAISRIEDQNEVKLFFRVGRNIKLTPEGKLLKDSAVKILSLLETTKRNLKQLSSELELKVVGPESLLAFAEMSYLNLLISKYKKVRLEYAIYTEEEAIQAIRNDKADIAFISGRRPLDLKGKKIGETMFSTFLAEGHPLFKKAKSQKIPVEEILKFPFVVPDLHQFGQAMALQKSSDGWRDDKFKRQVQSVVPSLFILMKLVRSGKMLAYIPDYLGESNQLRKLEITGCPYTCSFSIFTVFKETLLL